ncbi:MAG: hypothetical protein QOH30_3586 [Baekduia sp.]|nr:hypothetical protein [Baekduia sp.]
MRKAPLVLVLVAFAVWFFAWKGLPFLDGARPETFSTPTVQPQNEAELGNAKIKHGQEICADKIELGPGARYVVVTVLTKGEPAGRLRFTARGPGYRAATIQPAGTADNQQIAVPITPAEHTIADGTLCITNLGRHQVGFFAVGAPGPQDTPSQTTVDGSPIPLDLSITLLTSPSRSLGDRLGTVFDHMAAFNPLSGWTVWVLFVLALVGGPIAIGVALGRAAALDDGADGPGAGEPTAGPARGGS